MTERCDGGELLAEERPWFFIFRFSFGFGRCFQSSQNNSLFIIRRRGGPAAQLRSSGYLCSLVNMDQLA